MCRVMLDSWAVVSLRVGGQGCGLGVSLRVCKVYVGGLGGQ